MATGTALICSGRLPLGSQSPVNELLADGSKLRTLALQHLRGWHEPIPLGSTEKRKATMPLDSPSYFGCSAHVAHSLQEGNQNFIAPGLYDQVHVKWTDVDTHKADPQKRRTRARSLLDVFNIRFSLGVDAYMHDCLRIRNRLDCDADDTKSQSRGCAQISRYRLC